MDATVSDVGQYLKIVDLGVIPSEEYVIGSTVLFGHFNPDNNEGENDPIEWIILDNQDGTLRLLSKYVLTARFYNETRENVSWSESSLYKWLNTFFYENAFSEEEQTLILNSKHGSDNDSSELDAISLLDSNELMSIFATDDSRICYPTKYARSKGAMKQNGASAYWLRIDFSTHYGEIVSSTGKIITNGTYTDDHYIGIRPCLYITVD